MYDTIQKSESAWQLDNHHTEIKQNIQNGALLLSIDCRHNNPTMQKRMNTPSYYAQLCPQLLTNAYYGADIFMPTALIGAVGQ